MSDELIDPDAEAQLADAFAQLQANYGTIENEEGGAGEEESEEGEEGDEESGEEGNEEGAGSGTGSDDEEIDLGSGVKLKRSELIELNRLREFLDSESSTSLVGTAQALEQARLNPPTPPTNLQPTPAFTPPTPPPELDLEDPTIKFLWDQQVANAHQLELQRQEFLRRDQAETIGQVNHAVADWSKQYKLDDATLNKVRDAAAKTGIAPAMQAQGRSTYEACVAALEGAFWSDPALRTQYLDAVAEDNKKLAAADKTKQRKLAALSGRGSSSSSPKPPVEMTAEERKAGMIAELTKHLTEA